MAHVCEISSFNGVIIPPSISSSLNFATRFTNTTMDKILHYLGLAPSKPSRQVGVQADVDLTQDSLNLYKLAREAWTFDRRTANLVIADTAFSYVT
jgi:hypothetical protein